MLIPWGRNMSEFRFVWILENFLNIRRNASSSFSLLGGYLLASDIFSNVYTGTQRIKQNWYPLPALYMAVSTRPSNVHSKAKENGRRSILEG